MDSSSNKEGDSSGCRLLINGELYPIEKIEKEIIALEEEVNDEKKTIKSKEDALIFKKICLRESSLKQQFDKFIARQPEAVKKAVYLNNCLLRFVIKSYYDDIHRYKSYSGSKWANHHKQAAYTIKWIARFKPIQIREEFDNERVLTDKIVDINLVFALRCGFAFLKEESIDLIAKEKKEVDEYNLSLSAEDREEKEKQSFYDKLLYNLRYRSFLGKHLISIFEALELRTGNFEPQH